MDLNTAVGVGIAVVVIGGIVLAAVRRKSAKNTSTVTGSTGTPITTPPKQVQ